MTRSALTLAIAAMAVAATAPMRSIAQAPAPAGSRVTIEIDAGSRLGPLKPMWAWFGYDELNYTDMRDGRKRLTELAALSPVPVYVRAHNLLTTGDGTPALKWGSTDAYTERTRRRADAVVPPAAVGRIADRDR